MNKYEFHSLDHFERKPTSDRQNYFEARTKQTADNNLIILEPIKKNNEDRNGNKFTWIFGSFGIGLSVLLFV
jgi:rhomboid protease GluP